MHNPTTTHVRMLQYCLGYLYRHREKGITYLQTGNVIETQFRHLADKNTQLVSLVNHEYRGNNLLPVDPLVGMSDADYANSREEQRKSISGFCFFAFGCLVSWKSKLQPITATSTHEAELIALTFAADEGIWLRRLLTELHFSIPNIYQLNATGSTETESPAQATLERTRPAHLAATPILGDNKSSIHTCVNPDTSLRSRHLEVRWFKIRDYITEQLLRVHHIPTECNVSDHFTKPKTGSDFHKLTTLLMGHPRRERTFVSI